MSSSSQDGSEKEGKKPKIKLANIKNQFIEFGKNLKMASHKMNAKLGVVDITPDHEYDQLKLKFKESHRAAKNAAAHANTFADQFFAVSASVSLVFRDLESAYDPSDPMVPYVRRIFQKLGEYDVNVVKNYHTELLEQVMSSIVQYRQEMDSMKKLMKERDEMKMKYDVLRTKMRKIVEKRNKEPAKAAEKIEKVRDDLRTVEKEYTSLNTNCKSLMLEAINSRGNKIDPVIPKLTAKIISMFEDLHNVASAMNSIALETKDKRFNRVAVTMQDVPSQNFNVNNSSENPSESQGSDVEEDTAPKPQQQTHFEPRKLSSPPAMEANPFKDLEWFYLDDGVQQQGPVTFEKFRQLFKSNSISGDTYVFAGEMENWKQISEIPKLKQFLQ